MVIKADALHYKTDVFSNLAVLTSFTLVTLQDMKSSMYFVGGNCYYIIYSAYELIHDGILVLLDRVVDEDIVLKIKEIITQMKK